MPDSQTPAAEAVEAIPTTVEAVGRWLAAWADADDEAKAGMVREFLLAYAWAEDSQVAKTAVVECIMAQGRWRHVTALADEYAGAQFEQGPEAFADGIGFALTALYECHDGPHQPDCPSAR
jgi:hypothetical protein